MSIKIADTLRTDNSRYPIALSEDIQGGIRGVQSKVDLAKINQSLIADGMLVWVQDEDSYYKYTNNSWSILKTSSNQDTLGIQLLTSNQIKLLKEQDALPETYIWIRTKDEIDFDGEITDKTYTTTKNGNYIDILFQAVRQLQTEVAKMRNTFKYGMYSCTHKEMAISNVVNDKMNGNFYEYIKEYTNDTDLFNLIIAFGKVSFKATLPFIVGCIIIFIRKKDSISDKGMGLRKGKRSSLTCEIYWK